MNEYWAPLEEFPLYQISDQGRILNLKTGRILKSSFTSSGVEKVGLFKEGHQYVRSVSVLIAETFIEKPTLLCDTPIHLNGDKLDNRALNIAWRPRWFAWKHARQFLTVDERNLTIPVVDIRTSRGYPNINQAVVEHGLLFEDVWRSIHSGSTTYPYGQIFEIVFKN